MSQDRAQQYVSYRLTHEFLAYMLGVRGSGVTEAAGRLQAQKLIRYSRGKLTVIDRSALEALACPCNKALTSVYIKHPRS